MSKFLHRSDVLFASRTSGLETTWSGRSQEVVCRVGTIRLKRKRYISIKDIVVVSKESIKCVVVILHERRR